MNFVLLTIAVVVAGATDTRTQATTQNMIPDHGSTPLLESKVGPTAMTLTDLPQDVLDQLLRTHVPAPAEYATTVHALSGVSRSARLIAHRARERELLQKVYSF